MGEVSDLWGSGVPEPRGDLRGGRRHGGLRGRLEVGMMLLLAAALAADPLETEVDALAARFAAAAAAQRWGELRSMCSPEFLRRERLSCDRLVTELEREEIGVEPAGSALKGKLAVTAFWMHHPKGDVAIWLLAERTKQGWQYVDGSDERGGPLRGVPLQLPQPSGEVPEGVRAIVDSVNAGDLQRLSPLCTERMQATSRDGCEQIASQVQRKGLRFELTQYAPAEVPARALGRAAVLVGGEREDEVMLYLEQRGDRWLLAGIDESDAHARDFSRGQLPAHVETSDLVDAPDLLPVAAAVTERAAGRPAEVPILALGPNPDVMWGEAPLVVETVWTRHLPGTDRYVICHRTSDGLGWTSWRRSSDGWELLRHGQLGQAEDCRVGATDIAR
jgi:hypothetical protein